MSLPYEQEEATAYIHDLLEFKANLEIEYPELCKTEVVNKVLLKILEIPLPFNLQPEDVASLDTEADPITLKHPNLHEPFYESFGIRPGSEIGCRLESWTSEVSARKGNGETFHARILPPPGWKIGDFKTYWNGHTYENWDDPSYGPRLYLPETQQGLRDFLSSVKVIVTFGGHTSDLDKFHLHIPTADIYNVSTCGLVLAVCGLGSNQNLGLLTTSFHLFNHLIQETPKERYISAGMHDVRTILPINRPGSFASWLHARGHTCPIDTLYHLAIGVAGLVLHGLLGSISLQPLTLAPQPDLSHPLITALLDRPFPLTPGKQFSDLRASPTLKGGSVCLFGVQNHLSANNILATLQEEGKFRIDFTPLFAKGRLQLWVREEHPKVNDLWYLGSNSHQVKKEEEEKELDVAQEFERLYNLLNDPTFQKTLLNNKCLVTTPAFVTKVPAGLINPENEAYERLCVLMSDASDPPKTFSNSIPFTPSTLYPDVVSHQDDASACTPKDWASSVFPRFEGVTPFPKVYTSNRCLPMQSSDTFVLIPPDGTRVISWRTSAGVLWYAPIAQHLAFTDPSNPEIDNTLPPINPKAIMVHTLSTSSYISSRIKGQPQPSLSQKGTIAQGIPQPAAAQPNWIWQPIPPGQAPNWNLVTKGQLNYAGDLVALLVPTIGLRGIIQQRGNHNRSRSQPRSILPPIPSYPGHPDIIDPSNAKGVTPARIAYDKILPTPFSLYPDLAWWSLFRVHGRSFHEPRSGLDYERSRGRFAYNLICHYLEILHLFVPALKVEIQTGRRIADLDQRQYLPTILINLDARLNFLLSLQLPLSPLDSPWSLQPIRCGPDDTPLPDQVLMPIVAPTLSHTFPDVSTLPPLPASPLLPSIRLPGTSASLNTSTFPPLPASPVSSTSATSNSIEGEDS